MFDEIENLLSQNLKNSRISIGDLTGTGDHLDIQVISDEFVDLPLLQQHQKVMDILNKRFSEDLHAIRLKTLTFEKAKKKGLI